MRSKIQRAGEWFLHSGIQEPSGGVARYYQADIPRNCPVSSEITGYAVSTFCYLHAITGDQRYLERSLAAAQFLAGTAWDGRLAAMPFELDPPRYTYFFDCGIIIRGLLAAWRTAGIQQFLDVAVALGHAMMRDFQSREGDWHPILELPGKQPEPRDALRWSRSPGCYQLKSAMAWWDLAEATGENAFRESYSRVLHYAMATCDRFLPGHPHRPAVMDRLHPYCYFLEGLLPMAGDGRCATALCTGIRRVGQYLRDIATDFERSDVYAQLLRVRVYADALGAAALDREAAGEEASRLAGFQVEDNNPRVDGGFYFGRRDGKMVPHVNPVSTSFGLQALAMWDQRMASNAPPPHLHLLI